MANQEWAASRGDTKAALYCYCYCCMVQAEAMNTP